MKKTLVVVVVFSIVMGVLICILNNNGEYEVLNDKNIPVLSTTGNYEIKEFSLQDNDVLAEKIYPLNKARREYKKVIEFCENDYYKNANGKDGLKESSIDLFTVVDFKDFTILNFSSELYSDLIIAYLYDKKEEKVISRFYYSP